MSLRDDFRAKLEEDLKSEQSNLARKAALKLEAEMSTEIRQALMDALHDEGAKLAALEMNDETPVLETLAPISAILLRLCAGLSGISIMDYLEMNMRAVQVSEMLREAERFGI